MRVTIEWMDGWERENRRRRRAKERGVEKRRALGELRGMKKNIYAGDRGVLDEG